MLESQILEELKNVIPDREPETEWLEKLNEKEVGGMERMKKFIAQWRKEDIRFAESI